MHKDGSDMEEQFTIPTDLTSEINSTSASVTPSSTSSDGQQNAANSSGLDFNTDDINLASPEAYEVRCHCSICGKNFSRPYERTRHIDRKHRRRFPCLVPSCHSRPFGLKSDLERHSRTVHQSTAPISIPCPVERCSKSFSRKDNMLKHIKKIHEL
ncbi:hypothetical protein EJ04DRAFT_63331 [Polyplosphaeria fusca]|uniref:C2H2-type domain-containing protein n=1 Tax=Polyplosphaeria fusca TaxID=682080 RepID=A0A9P4QRG4_9PLEO|nr:hypothetical protein EJ04DRAFT_63331 [Polyplosphaeria fusca]